ncbi:MAG: hypothetical protein HZA91_03900 [Verrucomicrobia bacterium]|nr:hypothetical protein [Verrucomicrobiota bacterium]
MNKQEIIWRVRMLVIYATFICWFVFFPPRLLSWLLMFVAVVLGYVRFWRPRVGRWAIGFFLAALVAAFLPIDITFHNAPGPPHFVRYVCGMPSPHGTERHKRGEIYLSGSCLVYGNEPKYVLVW